MLHTKKRSGHANQRENCTPDSVKNRGDPLALAKQEYEERDSGCRFDRSIMGASPVMLMLGLLFLFRYDRWVSFRRKKTRVERKTLTSKQSTGHWGSVRGIWRQCAVSWWMSIDMIVRFFSKLLIIGYIYFAVAPHDGEFIRKYKTGE